MADSSFVLSFVPQLSTAVLGSAFKGGSFHLLRETRIAVLQLERRDAALQAKAEEWRRKVRG